MGHLQSREEGRGEGPCLVPLPRPSWAWPSGSTAGGALLALLSAGDHSDVLSESPSSQSATGASRHPPVTRTLKRHRTRRVSLCRQL